MLPTLIDHAIWADARAFDTITTLPEGSEERAQAERLYAHMAAAAHVWLSRLEGRAPSHPVWPDLPLPEAQRLAAESLGGLRRHADQDADALERAIEYRTSSGGTFRNSVREMITQVVLHGMHHRGQVALLTRRAGGTPAATDFIFYARPAPNA